MYFPISVCCSSCYCEILKEDGDFYFSFSKENNMYYLMKNNEVVQVLKGFKTQEKCKKHISLNKKLYFPIITLDMIENDICKDY
jgi:hypothetical protein